MRSVNTKTIRHEDGSERTFKAEEALSVKDWRPRSDMFVKKKLGWLGCYERWFGG
jgi:hypothetical protein